MEYRIYLLYHFLKNFLSYFHGILVGIFLRYHYYLSTNYMIYISYRMTMYGTIISIYF